MFRLFTDYTKWHYMYAVVNILRLAQEFTRFFLNLFSVPLFLKSLVSPIFSVPIYDVESVDVIDWVAVFIGGIVLRIVGAIFRLAFIVLGLFFTVINLVFFAVAFILWLIMPAVFVTLVYYVIALIFSVV